jgi:hypothetical protein
MKIFKEEIKTKQANKQKESLGLWKKTLFLEKVLKHMEPIG